MNHKRISASDIHIVYFRLYANAAARAADIVFTPNDVGKIAWQQDDDSLWLLTDDAPVTWVEVGTSAALPAGADTQVQWNNAGAFGASANFTFDDATNIMRVNGKMVSSGTAPFTAFDLLDSLGFNAIELKTDANGEGVIDLFQTDGIGQVLTHKINAGGETVFNEQGEPELDFRIESDTEPDYFKVDSDGGVGGGSIFFDGVEYILPTVQGTEDQVLALTGVAGGVGSLGWVDADKVAHSHMALTFATRNSTGAFYFGGYYDFAGAADVLAIPVAFGTANGAYGAHALLVSDNHPGGVATSITITGTSITDAGVRNAGPDTEVIVVPITANAGDYFETTKKWIGQITLQRTAGDVMLFNYGFCKYFDNQNADFQIFGFDCTWLHNATDSSFDILLRHHKTTGWTYNVAAPPDPPAAIESLQGDYVAEFQGIANDHHAWKRTDVNQSITGSGSEGFILEVFTGTNNSVTIGNFIMHYIDE